MSNKPSKWQCTNCDNREKAPIDPKCPECDQIGYRYPKDTHVTSARLDGVPALGTMRRGRRERRR